MAENEFLNGVRLEQFIKGNNDQVKDTMSGLNKTMSTGLKSLLSNQKAQLTSLKSIDKSSKSIDKNMSKILKNQDKMIKLLGGRVGRTDKDALTNKSMTKLISEVTKRAGVEKTEKRDSFKRKDYDESNNQLLGLMTDKLDVMSKGGNAVGGLLGGIGAMFAGGGLIGYLMTGKKEMLGNITKGLQFGLMGAKTMLPTILKNSPLMKAIPGIGLITGIVTGVSRFKRGDVEGGLLDITSGLVGLVPGIGTVASIGIGLYSMKRDFTMTTQEQATSGEVITDYWKNPENLKQIPIFGAIIGVKEAITLFDEGDHFGAVKALAKVGLGFTGLDKVAGIIDFFKDEGGIREGASTIGRAGANMFGFQTSGQKAEARASAVSSARATSYQNSMRAMSQAQKDAWMSYATQQGYSTGTARSANFGEYAQSMGIGYEYAEPEGDPSMVPSFGAPRVVGAGGIPSFPFSLNEGGMAVPSTTDAYYTQSGVNLSGVNDDVMHNFNGMFQEFNYLMDQQHPGHRNKFGMAGNRVQINSGYRSIAYQQQLYDQYLADKAAGKNPTPVARPGSSMHNYGYALDINSPEANIMGGNGSVRLNVPGSSNLMQKWGFDRPVNREPWHVEPRNLNYAKVRSGIGNTADSGPGGGNHTDPIGDAIDQGTDNLPSTSVARRTRNNQALNVTLSNADMETLARYVGAQMKANIKVPANTTISNNTGNPRTNL